MRKFFKSRIFKIVFISLVLLLIGYLNNHFFTTKMLQGKYINKNYDISFIEYNPHIADTLVIMADNQFESPFYGKGTYKITYGLKGTKIDLQYGKPTKEGEAVSVLNRQFFTTTISRSWYFGAPRIILFEELNQYYEKID